MLILGLYLEKPTSGGNNTTDFFVIISYKKLFFASSLFIPSFMLMQDTDHHLSQCISKLEFIGFFWLVERKISCRRRARKGKREARLVWLLYNIFGRSSSFCSRLKLCYVPITFCHIRSRRAMFKLCSNNSTSSMNLTRLIRLVLFVMPDTPVW